MKKKNIMYCLIWRIRRSGGVIINTRARTIYYDYQHPERIETGVVKRLCNEFGFGRQARMI